MKDIKLNFTATVHIRFGNGLWIASCGEDESMGNSPSEAFYFLARQVRHKGKYRILELGRRKR